MNDCEWRTAKEFASWAKDKYQPYFRLVKKDKAKPHGPDNSMFVSGTNKRIEDELVRAERWNKQHPITHLDTLLLALAKKCRNPFSRIDVRALEKI